MSLLVPLEVLARIEAGATVTDAEFYQIVKASLPHLTEALHDLAHQVALNPDQPAIFNPPTLTDEARGQILRGLASDAIRGCMERQFTTCAEGQIRLGFVNCHKIIMVRANEPGLKALQQLTTLTAQLLAQSPENLHC